MKQERKTTLTNSTKSKELIATYDSDSKRYHRFLIDEGQEITGTIYIPKDKEVPDRVTISLLIIASSKSALFVSECTRKPIEKEVGNPW